MSNIHVHKS